MIISRNERLENSGTLGNSSWERAKRRDALEKAEQRVSALRKRVADLEEEARHAGVLPGWLR